MKIDAIDPENSVTASDLVRHFGIWQERAARQPVFVMNRGRPRLVLASVNALQAALATTKRAAGDGDMLSMQCLIDAVRDMIVIADIDLNIVAVSHSFNCHFGGAVQPGMAMSSLSRGPTGDYAIELVQRVVDSGVAETAELMSEARPGRRLFFNFEPFPGGVIIAMRDVTDEERLLDVNAGKQALYDALGEAGTVATARINLRGYIDKSYPAMVRMTGLSEEALLSMRFVNLIEIGSRVAVGEAIEGVINDRRPRGLDAKILVARGTPRTMRLGFGAILHHGAIGGVLGAITESAG